MNIFSAISYLGITGLVGWYIKWRIQEWGKRRDKHQELLISNLKEWLQQSEFKQSVYPESNTRYQNAKDLGFILIECPRPPRDFGEHVAQHLVWENPRAIELLKDLKDIFEKCIKLRSRLRKEIGDIVLKKYEELGLNRNAKVSHFVNVVIFEISSRVEYNQEIIRSVKEYEGEEIILKLKLGNTDQEVARSRDSGAIEELEKLFNELVNTKEFRSKVEEIIKMRKEYDKKFEELYKIIEKIVNLYEHGNKLGGKCEGCPKFTLL